MLGLILIVHGFPKFKHFQETSGFFASQGFKPAAFWTAVVALVEFVGGIFLLFGFLTQVVALLVALQFIVILFKVKRGQKFAGGYEFDLLILAAAAALLTSGGGMYGIDAFFGLFLY